MLRRTFVKLWSWVAMTMGLGMSMTVRRAESVGRAPTAEPSVSVERDVPSAPTPPPWLGHARRPRSSR